MIFSLLSWASAVVVRPIAAAASMAALRMRDSFIGILLVAIALPSRARRSRTASLPQLLQMLGDKGRYCALIPAALMTFAESVISLSTNCLNSAGVIGIGSAPSVAQRSLISGHFATVPTSPAVLSTGSAGVPAGPHHPT